MVHFTDCVKAPGALSPGMDMRESSKYIVYHCVVTSRGRLEPAGVSVEQDWTLGSGGKVYKQSKFASAHDARATVISPMALE